MAKRAREVIVGGKNQKSVWWNDEIKAAVRRKESTWKEVLEPKDVWTFTKKREKLKDVYIRERRRSKNSLEGR